MRPSSKYCEANKAEIHVLPEYTSTKRKTSTIISESKRKKKQGSFKVGLKNEKCNSNMLKESQVSRWSCSIRRNNLRKLHRVKKQKTQGTAYSEWFIKRRHGKAASLELILNV